MDSVYSTDVIYNRIAPVRQQYTGTYDNNFLATVGFSTSDLIIMNLYTSWEPISNTNFLLSTETKNLITSATLPTLDYNKKFSIQYLTAGVGYGGNFNSLSSLRGISTNVDLETNITSWYRLFYQCRNLQTFLHTNLKSTVTDAREMFNSCNALESVSLFNTENVTLASSMFRDCYVLETIPAFNFVKVTNLDMAFYCCYSLQEIPPLNLTVVNSMVQTFSNCFNLKTIGEMNTENVSAFTSCFANAYTLRAIPVIDLSSATLCTYMFMGCYGFKTLKFKNVGTQTCVATSMFASCMGLAYIEGLTGFKPSTAQNLFHYDFALIKAPEIDYSECVNLQGAFAYCSLLEEVPTLNLDKATTLYDMFRECNNLRTITIGANSTPEVTTVGQMFLNARLLETINGVLNAVKITTTAGFNNTFGQCYSLREVRINNLGVNIQLNNCENLSMDSILYMIENAHTTNTITIRLNYVPLALANTDTAIQAALAIRTNVTLIA